MNKQKKDGDATMIDAKADEDCDDANDGDDSQGHGLRENQYEFTTGHLGREFSHIQKRPREVIPVLSLPSGAICCIKELETGVDVPSEAAVGKRELYAEAALVMFFPSKS